MSRTITVTYEVYTPAELLDAHPKGWERAHSQFLESLWEAGWGNEAIADDMRMAADSDTEDGRAVFGDRFLEWDLYRSDIAYQDGGLTVAELGRLARRLGDDRVMGDGLHLAFRHGQIDHHPDYYGDGEEHKELLLAINDYLDELYRKMMDIARQTERWLESDEYFGDHAEANEYLYDEHGRMRP